MVEPVAIHVLDKRVQLLQPADGFRTSLDSVMLAAACPARAGQRVLDLGCGVGGAAFCVQARVPGVHVTGVDILAENIALARDNIALNGAAGAASFTQGDIRAFKADAVFDHVIANPPYLDAGTYTPSPTAHKEASLGHTEDDIGVEDWINVGFRNLKSGGSFTVIHRADFTDKILQALGRRFGATEIFPLWPRAGEAAKRVVIRAVKDRQSPATLHAGLVLHQDGAQDYTPAAQEILRGMKALF